MRAGAVGGEGGKGGLDLKPDFHDIAWCHLPGEVAQAVGIGGGRRRGKGALAVAAVNGAILLQQAKRQPQPRAAHAEMLGQCPFGRHPPIVQDIPLPDRSAQPLGQFIFTWGGLGGLCHVLENASNKSMNIRNDVTIRKIPKANRSALRGMLWANFTPTWAKLLVSGMMMAAAARFT